MNIISTTVVTLSNRSLTKSIRLKGSKQSGAHSQGRGAKFCAKIHQGIPSRVKTHNKVKTLPLEVQVSSNRPRRLRAQPYPVSETLHLPNTTELTTRVNLSRHPNRYYYEQVPRYRSNRERRLTNGQSHNPSKHSNPH